MKVMNLKGLTIFLLLAASVLPAVFQSCTAEKDFPAYDDGYLHLTFSRQETKADISENGSGNFTEGDRIGLYIKGDNGISYRELVLTGGEWSPALKRSEFGNGPLSLSAHYPALPENGGESREFRISSDQTGEGRVAADLLFSSASLNEGEYNASMTFRHLMHRIRVNLEGESSGATVKVRSILSGTVDLVGGEVQPSSENPEWIEPFRKGDNAYEAIILPQNALPYRDGDGLVCIESGGKEHYFKAPDTMSGNAPFDWFASGKETTVNLRISFQETDAEWAGKKVWVYGITPPADSEWKRLFPNIFKTYYLKWLPEYGWYDCNKRNPSNFAGQVPDGLMCWAASSASLLHWWITCNMEYIEKYGDRYKGPDYVYHAERTNNGGLGNTTRQESDIFQCFIDSFDNQAGKGDDGVNWFIHGIVPTMPALENGNKAGYFKDVFPDGVKLGENIGGLGKETFNKAIKDALKNRKGIGIAIGNVRTSHVVTMWGAEFDDSGNVSAIYMADNNDRNEMEYFGVGCIRYEIEYVTMPEGWTMTHYNTGEIEDADTVPINRIVTLDLGEQYWKDYFAKNE